MRQLLLKTQVIDVTLRDGGYRNNFAFSPEFAVEHVQRLYEAGVDYVEVGYRNGSILPIENIGMTGMCTAQYLTLLREAAPHLKLVVIAHLKNITASDVRELADCGVALLRLCVTAGNLDETLGMAEVAKSRGMNVSLNIVRVSSIGTEQLEHMVSKMEAAKKLLEVVYLADSNGNLNPFQVAHLITTVKSGTTLRIGYHAHDNLGLAMANTMTAIRRGATYVDASLLGMGKGIGNLRLEQWIAYCRSEGFEKYSLESVLRAVNRLRSDPMFVQEDHEYPVDMLCGSLNVPFTERKGVVERLSTQSAEHVEEALDPAMSFSGYRVGRQDR
jgi:4-hydroxy 2-oxovalerate aldolase